MIKWIFELLIFYVGEVFTANTDQVIKEETITFKLLKINKTVPTPCDREMWLFTLNDHFQTTFYNNDTSKFSCNW